MSDIAIRVENLSKLYHIGALQKRNDTLRDGLVAKCRRANQSASLSSAEPNRSNLWAFEGKHL